MTSDTVKARNSFIRQVLEAGGKYLGRVDRADIPKDGLKFYKSRLTGRESLIEYHMFEINELPVLHQFRYVDAALS
jgi:hypothetical protein